MTRLVFRVLMGVLVPLQTLAADDAEKDLVKWVNASCPADADMEVMGRLDGVVSKALSERLKSSKYRDAVELAMAFSDCLESKAKGPFEPVFRERQKALWQVICFVPLVIVEVERKVDRNLSATCLARCPAPPEEPPKGEKAQRRWGEDVRRWVHLAAAAKEPDAVIEPAIRYLRALEATHLWPDPDGTKAQPEHDADDEMPDPLFAVRVLAVASAASSGNLDRLADLVGGPQKACASPFLASLGFLQAVRLPREAALPLILRATMNRTPLPDLLKTARQARQRFPDRSCALTVVVSALVLSGARPEDVDAAVASPGGKDEVAAVADAIPAAMPIPGSAATREAVLDRLVELAKEAEKGRRLCRLGDARIENGKAAEAVSAFREASGLLPEDDRECAVEGLLVSTARLPKPEPDALLAAARPFLAMAKEPKAVYGILADLPEGANRVALVTTLLAASKGQKSAPIVQEALIKLVDTDPGTPSAAAAVEGVLSGGGPTDPEERVIWGLVAGRHHVAAGDLATARKSFARSFQEVKPAMAGVRSGLGGLFAWLAGEKHYALLDEVAALARKVKALDAATAARTAIILGDQGERKRARAFLSGVANLKPDGDDWILIAEAWARLDDAQAATAALNRAGSPKTWGVPAWMAKGRIETLRKRYRESAAAYGQAAELARGDCDPLFFRGLARLLLGDPDGAEQDFRSCIEKGQAGHEVLGGLGYALFDQSRLDEAEEAFRDALKKKETTPDNHLGLALTLFRKGKLAEAGASLKRAIALEPVFGQGYAAAERKAFVYSDVEKKAWEDLVEALRKTP